MVVNFFGTDKTFELDDNIETYLTETLKDKLDNEKTLTDKWWYGRSKAPYSEEKKQELLSEEGLIENKNNYTANSSYFSFNQHQDDEGSTGRTNKSFCPELFTFLEKHFNGVNDTVNILWYDGDGYVGNHHNAYDFTKESTYYCSFVYCEEDDKSFFKYYDRDNDEVIVHKNKKGWSLNIFKVGTIDKTNPHCVVSYCERMSIVIEANGIK